MIARLASILLGIWFMVAPALFSSGPAMSRSDRICGPLVVTFSIVALSEVTRGVRWANVPVALWLMVAPGVLSAGSRGEILSSLFGGLAVLLLALPPGKHRHSYGGGWRALWR